MANNWPPSFASGSVLTASQLQALIQPPSCQAYDGTGISVASASSGTTLVPLSAEQWNYTPSPMHSVSTNPSRVYAPGSGKYHVDAIVTFSANSASYRDLYVMKNNNGDTTLGTGTRVAIEFQPTSASTIQPVSVSFEVSLLAGDYLEMYVAQNSGSTLTTQTGAGYTSLTLTGISQ